MCVLPLFPGLLEAWLVLTSIKYHGNLYILIPLNQRLALTRLRATGPGLRQMQFMLLTYCFHLLRVTKGARNPHFQVVVAHVSLVCSQDSFGPPLRMYGRHRMQFDNERLDLLSLEIWSFAFSPVTWNLRKALHWSKSFLTFDRCRPHSVLNLWLLLVLFIITVAF